MKTKKCLGVFDSGLGGLTVIKELVKTNIYDEIIYLGDTGRVPYGTRSVETIIKYAKQDAKFLLEKGATEIIIACGTVSSVAMNELKEFCKVPITGMINDTVDTAILKTKNNRIGIIGTKATISHGAFNRRINSFKKNITIVSNACPLFVPLVEYGFSNEDKIIEQACFYYLNKLKISNIDTLIMGCTHYPILEKHFKKYFNQITLINMATSVVSKLDYKEGKSKNTIFKYYVTDSVSNFITGASIFFKDIDEKLVKKITLPKLE
ncbi:MAG TPA: glutamate racemase [Bacteroidia bacterium]|nr:glutamate racemase [Bacteroidia bacterium]